MNTPVSIEVQKLFAFCENSISNSIISNPIRAAAIVALRFCRLVYDSLDPAQRKALAEAELYWSGQPAPRFEHYVDHFRAAITADSARQERSASVARNRLVWCTLNTNTPLDDLLCEYMIMIGLELGISVAQMKMVLESTILDGGRGLQ